MTDHNDDNDVTVSSRFWLWNYLNDDEKEQNGEENLFCHELSWRISSCLSSPLGPLPPPHCPGFNQICFFLQKLRRGEGRLSNWVFLPREFSIGEEAGSTRRKFIVRSPPVYLPHDICIGSDICVFVSFHIWTQYVDACQIHVCHLPLVVDFALRPTHC